MASRALDISDNALRHKFAVAAGQTVTEGYRVKLVSETTIQNCGVNEKGIGTAEIGSTVSGAPIVVMLDGHAVVPVKVGTGGATAGLYAKHAADGYINAPIADGTTPTYVTGIFMQTGVVGDKVGMLIGVPNPVGLT